jgi:hypothetical protein
MSSSPIATDRVETKCSGCSKPIIVNLAPKMDMHFCEQCGIETGALLSNCITQSGLEEFPENNTIHPSLGEYTIREWIHPSLAENPEKLKRFMEMVNNERESYERELEFSREHPPREPLECLKKCSLKYDNWVNAYSGLYALVEHNNNYVNGGTCDLCDDILAEKEIRHCDRCHTDICIKCI